MFQYNGDTLAPILNAKVPNEVAVEKNVTPSLWAFQESSGLPTQTPYSVSYLQSDIRRF